MKRELALVVVAFSIMPLACTENGAKHTIDNAFHKSNTTTAQNSDNREDFHRKDVTNSILYKYIEFNKIINSSTRQKELFFISIENHQVPFSSSHARGASNNDSSGYGEDGSSNDFYSYSGDDLSNDFYSYSGNASNSYSSSRVSSDHLKQSSLGLGSQKCNDLSINSIYESLLAKNIVTNQDLSRAIYNIYQKVLTSMRSDSRLHGSFVAWGKDNDDSRVLPVTQKHYLHNKLDELWSGHNTILALDYLLYNAKEYDARGIGEEIKRYRDDFYNKKLTVERGSRRDNYTGIPRSHYGIVKFDVPILELPGAIPWKHWARDTCLVDPNSSIYNRNVTRLNIPLACGISGSSTLALWVVLKSKVDLSEDEVRLLLLSIWAGLCADGGHALQEVLSAFKLNALYLSKIMNDKVIRNNFSTTTVQNLIDVTEDLAVTGAEQEDGKFGLYYDSFFSMIHNHDFQNAREKSKEELLNYLKSDCL